MTSFDLRQDHVKVMVRDLHQPLEGMAEVDDQNESANTSVDATTIGPGSANRLKLAKITTNQNTSTIKNGSGIASSP